jgi:hypothetical protein
MALNPNQTHEETKNSSFQLDRQIRNQDRSLEGWCHPVSEGRRLWP